MTFYGDMQTLATGLLTDFKQGVIQHVALTPGAGPAHRPGTSGSTTTTLPGGVASGVQKKYIDQGLAITGDLQVTAPVVAGLTVKQADKLLLDGVAWRVVSIIQIPAAGTPVAFVYVVRR